MRKIIPGITRKRSITTITRNPYRSLKFSDGSCYSVDNAGKKKRELSSKIRITLIVSIFELLILPEGGHFATDECFTKKPRVPSTRRETHLHVSHETTRIPRECSEEFFKTWKFFTRDIPNWYVYRNNTQNLHVHQKINLAFSNISNPLFVILCTSRLPFPLRCCITKRRAKTAGKTPNTTDFHTNSNPPEDISNPPCCDVTILFYTFPKVKKLWTVYEHCLRYSRCFKTFNNNLNTVNSLPLLRFGLTTFTLQGVFGGLKKLRCLYFRREGVGL